MIVTQFLENEGMEEYLSPLPSGSSRKELLPSHTTNRKNPTKQHKMSCA